MDGLGSYSGKNLWEEKVQLITVILIGNILKTLQGVERLTTARRARIWINLR